MGAAPGGPRDNRLFFRAMTRARLPIGIQTFRTMREGGYYYCRQDS